MKTFKNETQKILLGEVFVLGGFCMGALLGGLCLGFFFPRTISQEPFGALRSVMVHFFCIFPALSFELNFF